MPKERQEEFKKISGNDEHHVFHDYFTRTATKDWKEVKVRRKTLAVRVIDNEPISFFKK